MAGTQVALAKLSWPRLHDALERTRLYATLDDAQRRPATWLCGPPGAGKTTLVASHAAARRRGGVWYQVDADDADPASFVYHLNLAAQALPGVKAADALPLLGPEFLADLDGFARRYFRALFARMPRDGLLVLDNLQDLPDDAPVHRLAAAAMSQVPPGLHVVVTSRAEPPPAYAGLIAADAITVVDGAALRLAPEETQAIARRRGVDDATLAARLHERCQGWAAGLTLLLARRDAAHDEDDPQALQHVFGFFAQRVFDAAPAPHRQALMALSFLPSFTADLAARLTGLADAGRLLEHLHRRQLFIERHRAAGGATYQFHALFRSFLQHQARGSWGAAAWRDGALRAASVLDDAGQPETALALYADAGAWDAHAAALMAVAEGLLEQGRHQGLLERLAAVPAAERAARPWLAYWEGRASMAAGSKAALPVLQACHAAFEARGDAAGQVASAAAVVQGLWFARLGWSEIGPWIERIEPVMQARLDFPSAGIELMSVAALHAALAFCRPAHAGVRELGLRLLALVDDESVSWGPRLSAATHLLTWLHNAGEHELAQRLVGLVDAVSDERPSGALQRAYWHVFRAMHDVRQGACEAAAARFDRAERLAREHGLPHAEFAALQFRVYLDIMRRRGDEARARLARMESHPARAHPDAALNCSVAQTLLAQLDGDVRGATLQAERALEAIRRVGAAYFQAVFPPLLASAFADGGQPERALALLAASRELARGSYLQAIDAQLTIEEAYAALVQGDAAGCDARLAQGLRVAAADRSRAAYVHRILVRKPVLLARALRAGLEPEFVRRAIRTWHIPPPADDVPGWPWPVRVRTLGGFEVLVDDAPVAFGRKAPKKTLALLKAVVARGGSASDAALVDTFWPDEEGDAAAKSLGAAVHRLRTLLGVPDAVVQQGGVVSLDRALVWVDAWAFERALETRGDAADEALALYRGPFLVEEEGEAWPVATRERLRARFIQAVGDRGTRLEAAARHDEAIACYLRGLEADAVVEPFYQGLMRCYHRLDRLPEAVSAYRRLKQTLSVVLSLAPSATTERLYRSLRG